MLRDITGMIRLLFVIGRTAVTGRSNFFQERARAERPINIGNHGYNCNPEFHHGTCTFSTVEDIWTMHGGL